MHKLKNKHTGEVITTPYLAEVEEYLKSGDYEMKTVYTKEMRDRGELPQVGMRFLMGELNDDNRFADFSGSECKVIAVGNSKLLSNYDYVVFYNENLGIGCLIKYREWMLPIPTLEDELTKLVRGYYGGTSKAKDLANEIISKYNITPKEGK